ncbi:MAG: ankyrin repeat domain-containing protein [Burkholderiaceae bacterium]|jgi:hypothetical protein|nr:ankyrin repeat domain-containing protein [Burkholderiaceae bacterium]
MTRRPLHTWLCSLVLVLQSLLPGHAASRQPHAYFSGDQLALAQAILQGTEPLIDPLARHLGREGLNRPGTQDMTLLFFALQSAMGEKPRQLRILTTLVRAGADPTQEVPDFGSVLGVALRARSPLYVQALLDAGVSPDTVLGSSPILFDAASEHTAATLALLLDRGATIDKKNTLGNTALMKALQGMQLDQVMFLLDRGASPHFVNINGVSFAGQLQFQIARQQDGSPAQRRMLQIRDRITGLGVAWPPLSRDEERQRMRERGQVPDKLLPVQ